jgi:hypothetical protein
VRTSLDCILFAAAAALLLGSLAAPSRADILYASDQTNKIEKFTAGGVGSLFANTGFSSQPEDLAFDSLANLYVANSIQTLTRSANSPPAASARSSPMPTMV